MQKIVGKSLYDGRKPSYLNLILNVIIILFVLVFIAELTFNSAYTNIYVKGQSMTPTLNGAPTGVGNSVLEGGDYVFVNTRIKPDYFDIVVVETGDKGHSYDIIKRVVAFGGDTVKMDRGQLSVKYAGTDTFVAIDEPYVLDVNNDPSLQINNFGEHVVEEGCMFLLGDNRNVSEDSRRRGDFSLGSLVGVVPKWSLKNKSMITKLYSFFEFKLGFSRINNIYGD